MASSIKKAKAELLEAVRQVDRPEHLVKYVQAHVRSALLHDKNLKPAHVAMLEKYEHEIFVSNCFIFVGCIAYRHTFFH
jgi:hypothetical protein